MTIAENLGFVVGEKYEVITGHGDVSRGEVLTLLDDDDSINPYFERGDGEKVCPYLSAFMHLSQKEVKSETNVDSVEYLIQKRNEAKEALTKAQQELDEKLEFLGLQEKDNEVVLKSTENFEWVEADWTEFSIGDPIKVIEEDAPSFTGVIIKVDRYCRDGLYLKIEYDLKDDYNWFGGSNYKFYRKVNK